MTSPATGPLYKKSGAMTEVENGGASGVRSAISGLKPLRPKSARGHRAMKERESKVVENVKQALFLRGSNCSEVVHQAMQDLASLKKPDAIFFTRKNELHPFDMGQSSESLSFFSQKNDVSLLVVGNHSKKRPHSVCFARMFNHQLLDMIEFSIVGYRSIYGIGGSLSGAGLRPAMIFQGECFELRREFKMAQNLFLDFFNGQQVSTLNISGLESAVVLTALEDRVLLRVYRVSLQKGKAELTLMGPALDLKLGRIHFPADDLMRQACKVPKELLPKKVKNISHDAVGDAFGRVHVGDQQLGKIQTRKVKALKRNRDEALGIDE